MEYVGHHTEDGGHGDYEDHCLKDGNAEDGSKLVDVRSKFVEEDEGSVFVDFKNHVATGPSEALQMKPGVESPPTDLCEQKKLMNLWLWLPKMIRQRFLFLTVHHACLWSNCCIYNSYPNQSSILCNRDICLDMHRGKHLCKDFHIPS